MEQHFTVLGNTAKEIFKLAKEEAERFFGEFNFKIEECRVYENEKHILDGKIIHRTYEANVLARVALSTRID